MHAIFSGNSQPFKTHQAPQGRRITGRFGGKLHYRYFWRFHSNQFPLSGVCVKENQRIQPYIQLLCNLTQVCCFVLPVESHCTEVLRSKHHPGVVFQNSVCIRFVVLAVDC